MAGRLASRTPEDWLIDAVVAVSVTVLTLSIILPFWSMLVDSFSTPLFAYQRGIKLWPVPVYTEAYAKILSRPIVYMAYGNTIIRSAAGVALTLVVCFAASYSLSKQRLPLRRSISIFLVVSMFFSGGLVPTYLWYRQLGLINRRIVLIAPYIAQAFYIIVMRRFVEALPDELEESAFIDGASVYTVLLRIVLPLSKPVLATVGLWAAVFHWNEWFSAMIYTTRRDLTVLQLLLRRVLIEFQASSMLDVALEEAGAGTSTEISVRAATMFVSIGPIILLYPFIQRYFVRGIMVGSVKG
jgi:putative aldouronate transport system permease protein